MIYHAYTLECITVTIFIVQISKVIVLSFVLKINPNYKWTTIVNLNYCTVAQMEQGQRIYILVNTSIRTRKKEIILVFKIKFVGKLVVFGFIASKSCEFKITL